MRTKLRESLNYDPANENVVNEWKAKARRFRELLPKPATAPRPGPAGPGTVETLAERAATTGMSLVDRAVDVAAAAGRVATMPFRGGGGPLGELADALATHKAGQSASGYALETLAGGPRGAGEEVARELKGRHPIASQVGVMTTDLLAMNAAGAALGRLGQVSHLPRWTGELMGWAGGGALTADASGTNPLIGAVNAALGFGGLKAGDALFAKPLAGLLGRYFAKVGSSPEGIKRAERIVAALSAGPAGVGMSAVPHVSDDIALENPALWNAAVNGDPDAIANVAANVGLTAILRTTHADIPWAAKAAYLRGDTRLPPEIRARLDAEAGPLYDALKEVRAEVAKAVEGKPTLTPEAVLKQMEEVRAAGPASKREAREELSRRLEGFVDPSRIDEGLLRRAQSTGKPPTMEDARQELIARLEEQASRARAIVPAGAPPPPEQPKAPEERPPPPVVTEEIQKPPAEPPVPVRPPAEAPPAVQPPKVPPTAPPPVPPPPKAPEKPPETPEQLAERREAMYARAKQVVESEDNYGDWYNAVHREFGQRFTVEESDRIEARLKAEGVKPPRGDKDPLLPKLEEKFREAGALKEEDARRVLVEARRAQSAGKQSYIAHDRLEEALKALETAGKVKLDRPSHEWRYTGLTTKQEGLRTTLRAEQEARWKDIQAARAGGDAPALEKLTDAYDAAHARLVDEVGLKEANRIRREIEAADAPGTLRGPSAAADAKAAALARLRAIRARGERRVDPQEGPRTLVGEKTPVGTPVVLRTESGEVVEGKWGGLTPGGHAMMGDRTFAPGTFRLHPPKAFPLDESRGANAGYKPGTGAARRQAGDPDYPATRAEAEEHARRLTEALGGKVTRFDPNVSPYLHQAKFPAKPPGSVFGGDEPPAAGSPEPGESPASPLSPEEEAIIEEFRAAHGDAAAEELRREFEAPADPPAPPAERPAEPASVFGGGGGRGPLERGPGGSGPGGAGGRRALRDVVPARPEHTHPVGTEGLPEHYRAKLTPEQQQGVVKAQTALRRHGGFLLADGTGTGKSWEITAIAQQAAKQGKPVLIVAPSSVLNVQDGELNPEGSYAQALLGLEHTTTPSNHVVLGGKRGWDLKPGRIHFTTYEGMNNVVEGGMKPVVIFDEAHYLKNVRKSQRAATGMGLADRAESVMFATATPIDKAEHLGFLKRAGILEGRSENEQYRKLGLRPERGRDQNGKPITVWDVDPLVGSVEVRRRIAALFDRLTSKGQMVKREISLKGMTTEFKVLPLSSGDKATLARIESEMTDGMGLNNVGALKKAHVLQTLRRQQEPMKVATAAAWARKELDAGRQVVIFLTRIRRSDVKVREGGKGDEKVERVIYSSEGTARALKQELERLGIKDIGEVHGESEEGRAEDLAAFQAGRKRVVIATFGSGGAGVNMDDVRGDAPRSMMLMTAPFDAQGTLQALGRVWRLTTKTDANAMFLFADTPIDDWNRAIIAQKLQLLGAVVKGETGDLQIPADEDLDLLKPQDLVTEQPPPSKPPAEKPKEPKAPPTTTGPPETPPTEGPPPTPPEKPAAAIEEIRGKEAPIEVAGLEKPVPARYSWVRLGDILPSHDFPTEAERMKGRVAWSPGFNRALQQRDYSDELKEQEKVYRNARERKYAFFLSDDPAPTSGPSMLARDGSVLNGNGRAMTLKLWEKEGTLQGYLDAAREAAPKFGLEAPPPERGPWVIARVTDLDPQSRESIEVSRLGNVSHTEALTDDQVAEQLASTIDDEILEFLRADPDTPVGTALNGPRGLELRKKFEVMLPESQRKQFIEPDTKALTTSGKEVLQKALLYKVLPQATVRGLPDSMRRNMEGAVVQLVLSRTSLGEFDPTRQIIEALNFGNAYMDRWSVDPERVLNQTVMFGERPTISPGGRMWLEALWEHRDHPRVTKDLIAKWVAEFRGSGASIFGGSVGQRASDILKVKEQDAASFGAPGGYGKRVTAESLLGGEHVTIRTQDGKRVEGYFLRRTDRRLVLETEQGEQRVPIDSIKTVALHDEPLEDGPTLGAPEWDASRAAESTPAERAERDPFAENRAQIGLPPEEGRTHDDVELKMPPEPTEKFRGKVVGVHDVLRDLAAITGAPIRTGRIPAKWMAGVYWPWKRVVRVRTANELSTAFHEIGHSTERIILAAGGPHGDTSTPEKLKATFSDPHQRSDIQKELVELGRDLYGKRRPQGGYASEGVAEFWRYYLLHGREAAAKKAPKFTEWIEKEFLPTQPIFRARVEKARDTVEQYQAQGVWNRSKAAMVDWKGYQGNPLFRFRRYVKSGRMSHDFLSTLEGIERAEKRMLELGMPPEQLAERGPYQTAYGTQGASSGWIAQDFEGPQLDFSRTQVVGPGLKEILAPVAEDEDRFVSTWYALHALERLGYDVDEIIGRPFEEANRFRWKKEYRAGPMTPRDLHALLHSLPPEDLARFQRVARQVGAWHANHWANLANMGVITPARVKRITTSHGWKYYAPLFRVVDKFGADYWDALPPKGGASGSSTATAPSHRITFRGSGLRVQNIVDSIVNQSRVITAWGHQQKILQLLADGADYGLREGKVGLEGLGDIIEHVKPNLVPESVKVEQLVKKLNSFLDEKKQITPQELEDLPDYLELFRPSLAASERESVIPVLRVRQVDVHNPLTGETTKVPVERVELYRIAPSVLDGFAGLEPHHAAHPAINFLLRGPLMLSARMLKLGATGLNPAFGIVRNALNDLQTYIQRHPDQPLPRLLFDWARAWPGAYREHVAQKKKKLPAGSFLDADRPGSAGGRVFEAGGGRISSFLGAEGFLRMRKDAFSAPTGGAAVPRAAGKIVYGLMDLLNASDMVPRRAAAGRELKTIDAETGGSLLNEQGGLKRSLTWGESMRVQRAGRRASVDFFDGGTFVRWLNQYVPFLNARTQGVRLGAKTIKEHPLASLWRWIAVVATTTLPLWLKNRDDDEYQDQTPRQRANYYTVDGVRIPRSQDAGQLYGAIPEALFNFLASGDEKRLAEDLAAISDNLGFPTSPEGLTQYAPPPLTELLQQGFNRDFYFDTKIEPRYMENRRTEEKFRETTPGVYRVAGKALGIAPVRLEHAANALTGGLAREVIKTTTPTTIREPADVPVVGTLFQRESRPSYSVEQVFDAEEKVSRPSLFQRETPVERRERLRLKDAVEVLRMLQEGQGSSTDPNVDATIQTRLREVAEAVLKGDKPPGEGKIKAELRALGVDIDAIRRRRKNGTPQGR